MKIAGKIFVMLVILALILVPLAACEGTTTTKTVSTGATGATGATGEEGPAGPPGRTGEEGAQGEQGPAGEDGATWFTGAGVPAVATGADSDLYLNTVNGDVYKKASGKWTKITNITGPAGTRGATGPQGAAGAPGTTMVTCPFVVPCSEIYLGDESSDLLTVDATSVFNTMVYLQDGLDVDGTAEFDGTVVANSNVYLQSNLDVDGKTELDGNVDIGDNSPSTCSDTLNVYAGSNFYCDVTVYDAVAHLNIAAVNGTLIIGPDVLNATPDVRFKVDGPTGSLFIGPDVLVAPDIRFSVDGSNGNTTVMGHLYPEGDIEKTGTGATNDLIITASGATANTVQLATGTLGSEQWQLEVGNDDGSANDYVATYGYLDPQGDILKTTGALTIETTSGDIIFKPAGTEQGRFHSTSGLYIVNDLGVGTSSTGSVTLSNYNFQVKSDGETTVMGPLHPQADIEKTGSGATNDLIITASGATANTVQLATGTLGSEQWQLEVGNDDGSANDYVATYGYLDPQGDILKTTGALDIATSSGAITISPGTNTELTIDDTATFQVTVAHDLEVVGISHLDGQVTIGSAGLQMGGHIVMAGSNVSGAGTVSTNYLTVNTGMSSNLNMGTYTIKIDSGTVTATNTALDTDIATLDRQAGIVTSSALGTLAGAIYTLTLTDNKIASTSNVLVTVGYGTCTTGLPLLVSVVPGAGNCVITIGNIAGAAPFNGTLEVHFLVVNP